MAFNMMTTMQPSYDHDVVAAMERNSSGNRDASMVPEDQPPTILEGEMPSRNHSVSSQEVEEALASATPSITVRSTSSEDGGGGDATSNLEPNGSYSSVVSAVTRTCAVAALTASQCFGEAHRKASDVLASTVGYFARPLGSVWSSMQRSALKLSDLSVTENPYVTVLGCVYDVRDERERDALLNDCRSRVLFTYRKGFTPIIRTTTTAATTSTDTPAGKTCTPPASPIARTAGFGTSTRHQGATDMGATGTTPSSEQAPQLPFLRRVICEDNCGNLISDAGWGCMIRSTQMAVCQALLTLRLGREWRRNRVHHKSATPALLPPYPQNAQSSSAAPLQQSHVSSIVSLFHDTPTSPLSLHNITAYGSQNLGIALGHWMGPTSCAQAVAGLMTSCQFESAFLDIRPVVFPDGLIIHSEVHAAFNSISTKSSAVLLILCMRLGTVTFNAERYSTPLKACFRFPHFQGLAGRVDERLYHTKIRGTVPGGGSWVSAHYFFGECDRGLLFLDPHIAVQEAYTSSLRKKDGDALVDDVSSCDGDLSQFFLPDESFSEDDAGLLRDTNVLLVTPWKNLNPSLALYFLCRDLNDYHDLIARLKEASKETSELFEMVDIPHKFYEAARKRTHPTTLCHMPDRRVIRESMTEGASQDENGFTVFEEEPGKTD